MIPVANAAMVARIAIAQKTLVIRLNVVFMLFIHLSGRKIIHRDRDLSGFLQIGQRRTEYEHAIFVHENSSLSTVN
jgi:hypothetical protein